MKLLLDENLSPRLIEQFGDLYPGSRHVDQCELGRAEDAAIWEYARKAGFAILSKDSDFAERSVLFGAPPKIIWLSVGNAGTLRIAQLLRDRLPDLVRFENDSESSLLVVTLEEPLV